MSRHLSLRLPWHDRGWDGHVCDQPTANVYCSGEYGLKAHEIRVHKHDDEEERLKGKPCHLIKAGNYRPPCLRTINTFGGVKALAWKHHPKEFLATDEYPIEPVDDQIKPFTAGTWPYDRVFRREAADEDTPEERI